MAKKKAEAKVYLVGAGPGDPELVTVKGKRILQQCDAVIYDHLVPDELIITLPANIEKIYAGKKAGSHVLAQDDINRLLVELAKEGKNIARLKGGDPFIFGRGGEEAEYLKNHNIEFEIIPGITSGLASPAYAGMPCTDRRKASFVVLATGHKAKEKDSSTVPWEWLAQAKNGTLVIYMGVGEFDNIKDILISNGLPPDTPSAVIERGTFPSQRIVTSPLFQLSEKLKEMNIKPPSIFIIGDTVEFQKELSWFAGKPLSGIRIMVTRPADQAQEMYQSLRELGAEVLPYPSITTEEYRDNKAWKAVADIEHPSGSDHWLIFTSENGVRYFFNQLFSFVDDIRFVSRFKIAAVGYGTAKALQAYKLAADFLPSKSTTACLADEMINQFNFSRSMAIRIRGNLGDTYVEKTLASAGAQVIPLQTYRTLNAVLPDGFKEKLFAYPPDVIIFTSGSTVDGLFGIFNNDEIKKIADKALVVSIGPSTSRVIRSHGLSVSMEAKEYGIPGIITELLNYYADKVRKT
jgi:uroporphyrinogen III methyltransferase/synthase